MRWLVLLLLIVTLPSSAMDRKSALSLGVQRPVLDLDFTRMDKLDQRVTFTRASASSGYNCAVPQTLVTFGNNTATVGTCDRIGNRLGIGLWGQSTIQNLWSRDLTNAVWVKSGVSVSLNQTGIDGSVNSASLVTATAPNGTVLQTLAGAGAVNRTLSADVKRISGTGPIYMTQDGGLHFYDITTLINSSDYTRVPAQGYNFSAQSPSLGFKLVSSGDAIAVDYVQLEFDPNLTYVAPTPRVLTTSAQAVRSTELLTVSLIGIGLTPNDFTVMVDVMIPKWFGKSFVGLSRLIYEVDDGTVNNGSFGYAQANQSFDPRNDEYAVESFSGGPLGTGTLFKTRCTADASNEIQGLIPVIAGAFATIAGGYNVARGVDVSCNNANGAGNRYPNFWPPTNAAFNVPPVGQLIRFAAGDVAAQASPLNGYIQRVRIYNGRMDTGRMPGQLSRNHAGSTYNGSPHLLLENGGKLLYEIGAPAACNQC